MQDEDGLHDGGGAAWAAAELGQDLAALERGDRAFAEDTGVGAVDGALSAGEAGPVALAFERCADRAAGALVALVCQDHDAMGGERVDEAVHACGGQVVVCARQRW